MNTFTPIQIRLFIGTFIAVFFLVLAQHIGLRLPAFISPIPKDIDAMTVIKPKLLEKKNTFTLKRPQRFIPQASADTLHDYENASAYVVMDFDSGDVLIEKNMTKRLPIASLTKIMTSVVALDLVSPERELLVTPHAAHIEPTKIGVIPGQKLTLKELLEASLMTSANDAVEVIREGVDMIYNEPVFVRAMNQKASYVGLKNTHFANPQGFDNNENYSSPEDLAILSRYALVSYPLISDIVKKDYAFLPENSSHKQYDLYNWNGLIGVYPNVSGVKIGNTDDAGMTTVVVSERAGKRLLVVLLGTPGILERDLWASQLLDEGFTRVSGLKPVEVTENQLREKYSTWKYGK